MKSWAATRSLGMSALALAPARETFAKPAAAEALPKGPIVRVAAVIHSVPYDMASGW